MTTSIDHPPNVYSFLFTQDGILGENCSSFQSDNELVCVALVYITHVHGTAAFVCMFERDDSMYLTG